jgi:hypothetical protein
MLALLPTELPSKEVLDPIKALSESTPPPPSPSLRILPDLTQQPIHPPPTTGSRVGPHRPRPTSEPSAKHRPVRHARRDGWRAKEQRSLPRWADTELPAVERLKLIDAERERIRCALEKAEAAVGVLNALGFDYRLQTGRPIS